MPKMLSVRPMVKNKKISMKTKYYWGVGLLLYLLKQVGLDIQCYQGIIKSQ